MDSTLLLAALVVITAALVSTTAGFGFGVLAIPVMAFLYPPHEAVIIVLVVGTCGVLLQWVRERRRADYRLVLLFIAGGLLGMPVGGYVLATISPPALRLLIGGIVLSAVALSLRRPEADGLPPRHPSAFAGVACGSAAGVMTTTVGQPGLILVLLLTWARWQKVTARATIFAVFLPMNLIGLAILTAQGTLSWPIVQRGLMLMPALLVGLVLGEAMFRRMSQKGFRHLMLGILTFAGTAGILNAAVALGWV